MYGLITVIGLPTNRTLFFAWGDDCFEAEQFISPGGFPCLVFACGELPYEKAEEVKSWFFLSIFIENVGLASF